jgi:YD repeat-containing protein
LRETTQLLPGGPVRLVTAVYDAEGNQTRLLYPGGRIVDRVYDELERPVQLSDAAPPALLASSWFQGPTLERRDLGNGTRLDAFHDNARRPGSWNHAAIGGFPQIAGRSVGWDASSNRDLEFDAVTATQRFYTYDSADRLVRSTVLPASSNIDYALDDAGNRTQVIGGANPGLYTCSPPECRMNRYTTVPGEVLLHDANGNLTRRQSGPQITTYVYDARDRLVQATSSLSGPLGSYRYDCLDRRIERALPAGTTRSLYDGMAEIEKQDLAGLTKVTIVEDGQGGAFDAPLFVAPAFVFTRVSYTTLGATYFYHEDDQGSVVAITDAAGARVERYHYGDFGETSVFDALGNPLPGSAVQNDFLYRGMRTELPQTYSEGWRHYSPTYGRWFQADALGG